MSRDDVVVTSLEHPPVEHRAERLAHARIGWQPPLMPGSDEELIKRFDVKIGFSPPGSVLLSRYVHLATGRYAHSLTGPSGPGWLHDRSIGVVQQFAVPGTLRLTLAGDRFEMTDQEGDLPEGRRHLGFVDQVPFVLMDLLELRVVTETGQDVLCASPWDPIRDVSEHVTSIGWIEPFPINPQPNDFTVEWTYAPLHRILDVAAWRHRYAVAHEPGAQELGWISWRPAHDLLPLVLHADGRLSTSLVPRPTSRPSVTAAAKWTAAPLRWGPEIGESRKHLTQTRLRALPGITRRLLATRDNGATVVLGHLATEGGVPLVSATHPVTGDQLITRSELEACDLGYAVDGILGHVVADRPQPPADTPDVPWGSHLGRGRRTDEVVLGDRA